MQQSPEFTPIEKPEITDNGFSEKRAARIIEGKQQDNSQVKKPRLARVARKIKLLGFRKKPVTKQPISRRDKI